MTAFETDELLPDPRPRTGLVVGLLVVAAGVFSYLGAYALPAALASAGVVKPWSAGSDPRLRWMLTGFVVTMVAFLCVACLARYASGRQLRRIDAMAEES